MTTMEHSFDKIATTYNYILYETEDPDTRSWFMVRSPLPLVTIIILYLLFTTIIGPNFMAKRSPYSLYEFIMVTNVFQIIANIWLCKQNVSIAWKDSNFICRGVSEKGKSQMELRAAYISWLYFMLKIADLSDTVIFVLRKKHAQLSFLHLYHHVGTLTIAWLAVKYNPGGVIIPVQLSNCLVHVIMFIYYTLAALGPKMTPYLWWKKYLTAIQIVQFFFMIASNASVIFFKCTFNKVIMCMTLPYTFSILILFMIFYKSTYSREKKKE